MSSNAAIRFDRVVTTPGEADVILVVGDGLIDPTIGDLLMRYYGKKRVIFLSPSTAGVSALMGCPHWCPYGKG
jgi:hypothetical protein